MPGERTEKASPRRRQRAREQGDFVRSRELLSSATLLAGVSALGYVAPRFVSDWAAAYSDFLHLGLTATWQGSQQLSDFYRMRDIILSAITPLGVVLGAGLGAGLFVGIAQNRGIGFYINTIQPKFGKLNPISNLKNLFSIRSATRLAKVLIPASVLMTLAIKKIEHQAELAPMSISHLTEAVSDGYYLVRSTAWILFVWSAVDYATEWFSWEKKMKMSKQDLRDEMKDSDGNPQIRGRIRGLQRQMRMRQLKADVKRATVVITNPTHYAIALGFDFETMEAPRVLTKGRNLLAQKIKEEALWAGVPIVENPPLARSLYRAVEPGHPIPTELYAAVAAILAYLYRKQVEEKLRREQAQRAARAEAQAKPKPQKASSIAATLLMGTNQIDTKTTRTGL
jgi:flagellar biosynthesis protein FlhB